MTKFVTEYNVRSSSLLGTTIHVSLTPELEARVRAKIDSGLYNNDSEVIREALRIMDTHKDWIHDLKIA